MDLAWISLAALIIAITLSMVTSVNVGVVSLALAWIVGVYLGGMPLAKVIGNFPIDLLVNLVGITLLFGMANNNGTLGRIAARAVRACRGNAGVIPIMLFFIALGLSSIGPGNIATTAIMAPMAMAVAMRAAVPPFLMALMVGNGAQAGALSRFAPTGIIVNENMAKIGLGGHETETYLNNLLAHAVVTFTAYFLFGGWRLFTRKRVAPEIAQSDQAGARMDEAIIDVEPFDAKHWLTMAILTALVVSVIWFRAHVGMAALTGAAMLSLLKAADEKDAIKRMPWSVILMVCGVTVLIGVLVGAARHRPVYRSAGAHRHAGNGHVRDRVRHRRGIGVQQHLRRGVAGLPADRARAGRASRYRPDGDRLVHERRRPPGRSLAALDHRRALHRGAAERKRRQEAVQSAAGVGPVDDGRRRAYLLDSFLTVDPFFTKALTPSLKSSLP